VAREKAQGQASLFGAASAATSRPALEPCEPYDPLDELSREREAVGFFLSGHPFNEYREFMDSLPVSTTRRAVGLGDGAWIDLAGVITSLTEARDRNKRLYARCHFEDKRGLIQMTVYADLYERAAEVFGSDSILVVGGRVRVKTDGVREIVAERVTTVDEALRDWTGEVMLSLDLDTAGPRAGERLDDFLRWAALPGVDGGGDTLTPRTVPLLVEVSRRSRHWLLRSRSRRVVLSLQTLRRLRDLPGVAAIRIRCHMPAPEPPRRNGGFRRRTASAG